MVSTPLYPMVLLIIIPMKNGYISLGILTQHFQTNPDQWKGYYDDQSSSTSGFSLDSIRFLWSTGTKRGTLWQFANWKPWTIETEDFTVLSYPWWRFESQIQWVISGNRGPSFLPPSHANQAPKRCPFFADFSRPRNHHTPQTFAERNSAETRRNQVRWNIRMTDTFKEQPQATSRYSKTTWNHWDNCFLMGLYLWIIPNMAWIQVSE